MAPARRLWLRYCSEYSTTPSSRKSRTARRIRNSRSEPRLCSPQSPQNRILWAEYACGIIFPNPGMDQPLTLRDEVTSLFAALALTQSVRVFQMRQYTNIFMAVPDCQ